MLYYFSMLSTDPAQFFIILLSVLLSVFLAISVHEWGHAFAAYKLGDPTAKNMGRMTLDPTKHLDPIGILCFVFLGLGWARPVIVNPRNLAHPRRDDILISIAGAVMNLITAFIAYGVYFIFTFKVGIANDVFVTIMATIVQYNIWLAIFNVIPIPPLDGYHVLSSAVIRKRNAVIEILENYGFLILIALLITGVLSFVIGTLAEGIMYVYGSFFSLFI